MVGVITVETLGVHLIFLMKVSKLPEMRMFIRETVRGLSILAKQTSSGASQTLIMMIFEADMPA
ncbi:MAG: hypothetical protein CMO45_10395 [Verrucomicrobiales bacterium]|nr:hypothetical protein [Verrucomicrobiales bacterium]